ncbi:MAG: class III extradiol dioxygenase subunit B-like domain-containing protein [Candidatus Moranbacteria bacterium]|nr:class III extradiol dioxygenase subunit B-like domain-containing protein [Candidatus Moranbacteria bacterium]
MLNFIGITTFSPAIVSSVAGKHRTLAKKTIKAVEDLGNDLAKYQPETVFLVSPRGPMRYDKFTINLEKNLKGSFSKFGLLDDEEYSFQGNYELARKILKRLRSINFPIEAVQEEEIDYGSLVPLSFLYEKLKKKPKIISLTFTSLDLKTHYDLGRELKKIFNELEENVAFLACGDLSQRISENSPAGYSPYGVKFDQSIAALLKKGDVSGLLNINLDLCKEAGEVGFKSIVMAAGLISDTKSDFHQFSYEAPLGSGYLVGKWKIK